jgi:hypothetical protein
VSTDSDCDNAGVDILFQVDDDYTLGMYGDTISFLNNGDATSLLNNGNAKSAGPTSFLGSAKKNPGNINDLAVTDDLGLENYVKSGSVTRGAAERQELSMDLDSMKADRDESGRKFCSLKLFCLSPWVMISTP